MRVGIITLTGGDNYGNVLQNYALQELLLQLRCEVETIKNTTVYGRFIPQNGAHRQLTPNYAISVFKSRLNYKYGIKDSGTGIVKSIRYQQKNQDRINKAKEKRHEAFKFFTREYIHWCSNTIDVNKSWSTEMVDSYDFFVSGSDQVWNPTYKSTSSVNFLQFAPQEKRITYAPSFGVSEIPEHVRKLYAKWLTEIPHLSVREQQGAKLINDLCGREATVVCDPTMTLSAEEWIKLERKPKTIPDKPYILTYFLGDRTKEYDTYIRQIKEKHHLEQINLWDVHDLEGYVTSPQEFIYLIHHAKLVCTDSFHGAVFSILMKTDFVTFPRVESGGSMGSRLQTLLSTFGLNSRQFQTLDNNRLFETDFSESDSILSELRENAVCFLSNALESKREIKKADRVLSEKVNCCGCSACTQICPKGCIKMESDSEGFLYPRIDSDQCIHCNACKRVCPVIQDNKTKDERIEAYVAYSNNPDVRRTSSSGGIFTELASQVISNGGVVFGAGFDERYSVRHQVASSVSELSSFRGSKYVQSEMGNCYFQIRKLLNQGKQVYFSGTPCQVAGLYSYLNGARIENLITQDIICHGVPSPAVWRKYIEQFSGIEDVQFRNKKYGWHYFSLKIQSKIGCYIKRLDEDFFLRLFLDNTILRPICYDCPMKKVGSCADITLADCWNPRAISADIKDTDEGLSLVLLNSEKGVQLWKSIDKDRVSQHLVNLQNAVNSRSAIKKSAPMKQKRASFFESLEYDTIQNLTKTWYGDGVVRILKKKYIFVKTKIRHIISK